MEGLSTAARCAERQNYERTETKGARATAETAQSRQQCAGDHRELVAGKQSKQRKVTLTMGAYDDFIASKRLEGLSAWEANQLPEARAAHEADQRARVNDFSKRTTSQYIEGFLRDRVKQ